MFTGIVQGTAHIKSIEALSGLKRFCIAFPETALEGVKTGASVAINGACLTVVSQEQHCLWFDVMMETLACTTLEELTPGQSVNFERAARFGDEIGGHLLSGHVHCVAQVRLIERPENNLKLYFSVPGPWRRYIFPKGYIAINGASLTIGEVDDQGFTVYLIPETIRATTFRDVAQGDPVNIEVDSQTQTIVDTLARMNLQALPG
ncbi:MAG: riboflavin synthase subunit alpha [Halomonadaceae bacterium]|nr:MAG: riboflavin synthase subunit alpha [Halomonadaceae bacterium]